MKIFVQIDIEATGIQPDNDLLEVGMVEMVRSDEGLWRPGRVFRKIQHTDREPESEFAKEHMGELYAKCNEAPLVSVPLFRKSMVDFFTLLGAESRDDVTLVGHCAASWDIPFLVQNGYFRGPGYETDPSTGKDIPVGDYNYRIYEIQGALYGMADAVNMERDEFKDLAEKQPSTFPMPEGKEHDAVYDCLLQIELLNGAIQLTRSLLGGKK